MKKLIITIIAAIFLASCQSPFMTVDPKSKKLVKIEPETVTIQIVIE